MRCPSHYRRVRLNWIMASLRKTSYCFAGCGLLLAVTALWAQTPARKAVYIPYQDAQPILGALDEILPAELKGNPPAEQMSLWPGWVARRDAAIRTRLAQGDDDSLVNFLLFGTSYTKQPRITPTQIAELGQNGLVSSANATPAARRLQTVLQGRMDDMLRALAAPRGNERLLFARRLLVERENLRLSTPAGQAQVKQQLLANLVRVLNEAAGYAHTLEAARLQGDASEEFAERSTLFRTRGLSSDTSLLPNYAIEESLKAMQAQRLITNGSVRRIAIIGPGLDFTDKQDGYDFYPQQTIQPFAIMDTLVRLGLARPETLQVTTLDLSARINEHLANARRRALSGQGYVVQLPRPLAAQWKPEAVSYWEHFGNQIGTPVPPAPVPANTDDLKIRAVRMRPNIVSRLAPVDLNIVLQRLELPAADQFDLIIATNIFVYYDVFEQSLAMANVARMLRPGGYLLSNNALLELPTATVRSVGYLTVVYSDRPNDGDHIVWYQHAPK